MTDIRSIEPALEAARRALRLLDEEHVPAPLRRVVAASGRRLPPPLAQTLCDHLERLDWLREKALEQLGDGVEGAPRLFLERPEGWESDLDDLVARREEESERRSEQSLQAANARLESRVSTLAAELAAVRADMTALREVDRSDAERARLSEANRALRQRIVALERQVAIEREQAGEVERLLAEADRRIVELRRRGRVDREVDRAVAPAVVGVGDPLALARSLDQLMASLVRVAQGDDSVDPPPPVRLPPGVRPDRAESIDWLLGEQRPISVLVDGYNVAFELVPTPDAAARLRVVQIGARLRRLADGPLTVVVVWDSDVDVDAHRSDGVDVRYVPSADASIVDMAGPGSVVVTNDRAVREESQRRGAVALWSHALVSWSSR